MNILFIDNFDSFTYNLVDEFEKRNCNVLVYRNNTDIEIIDKVIQKFKPRLIVISPGPSTPERAGISVGLIKKYYKAVPIFGVCLGYQCIIEAFNGVVEKCSETIHGKPSLINHNAEGIFKGLENPFQAGRYHSLIGSKIPDELEISAKTADKNLVMAVKHKQYNLVGVQFHPESILTPAGGKIIENIIGGCKMIQEAISKLVEKKDLTLKEAEDVMDEIMSGQATDAQIAGFLVALRLKGETIDEITACAKVMREKASGISPKVEKLVDVVGTGGDNSNTFNISTASAFVVAGAGVPVAKHGNKSVSSKSGAADVLTSLGVNIMLEPKQVEKCIEEIGIGFMFAPKFHSAMKYAIGPRKELKLRTVFNILGPLTNPASAEHELMGVFDESLTEPLAKVLANLGVKHSLVVHGSGMDEITLTGPTKISEYKDGVIKTYTINPEDFGMEICTKEDIMGGTPGENKDIILNILKGREKGAKRDIVVLNAAAALLAADEVDSIKEGIKKAEESIDSGKALEKLEKMIEFTNK
ncbi:MAG: anthranilate phosphoribosyltransferase [Nanoarchaeota archaeon]|nr:anthranilate phosphoribosyltransferase [Nanoarchaeota archaeon]